MAGRLLRVAVAALLTQGCLLPQEDPVLPDLPPKRNTPPELRFDTAVPARRNTVLNLDPLCPNKDRPFSIGVVDPDLGDTIYSRWYVDDDSKFTSLGVEGKGLDPRPTVPERGILKPIEVFYSTGALLSPMAHFVTVVIADRPFPPEGINLVLGNLDLPDGGTTPDTTKTAQYTWEVITDRTTCQ